MTFYFCFLFSAGAQKSTHYVSASAFKEFEMMSPYSPFGACVQSKLGPVFLSAIYRFDPKGLDEFQILKNTRSYAGKAGLASGRRTDEAFISHAMTIGYENNETLKKILTDDVLSTDAANNRYDLQRALLYNKTEVISVGYNFFSINNPKEVMKERFSLSKKNINRTKLMYNQVNFAFDLLFSFRNEYSDKFLYSPWNYYIPKELKVNTEIKKNNFGLRFRFDYVSYKTFGTFMAIGIAPGIKGVSSSYNDFGFSLRAGIIINVLVSNGLKKWNK